jgi:uncharacterized membrane protein
MRKLLQAISLISLAILWILTIQAIYGPEALPSRIPTHFDIQGNPNAWGSPNGIFLLPAIGTAIFLLIGLFTRNPAKFNYPVRVTPQNRDRLYALALQMTASIQAETICLFTILQYAILHSFRAGHFTLPPTIVPTGVVLILVTTLGHITAMRRTR